MCVKDVEVHRIFVEIKYSSSFGLFSLLFEFKKLLRGRSKAIFHKVCNYQGIRMKKSIGQTKVA